MNHKLALEIPDTLNTQIFRVEDFSYYNENVPITCKVLEITVPGFKTPAMISDFDVGFNLNLTSCDLKIQKYDCDKMHVDIPDGVYHIRYSVSPNDLVYVDYYHLRTSLIMSRYKQVLCDTVNDSCEPSKEIEEKLKLLHEIFMYIQAAKSKADTCHDIEKSIELYKYAKKLLSKFDCLTC